MMWQAEVVTALANSATQDPEYGPGNDEPVTCTAVPSGPEVGVKAEITGMVAPAVPVPNVVTARVPSNRLNIAKLALSTPDTEFTRHLLRSRTVTGPVDHKKSVDLTR